VGFDGAVFAGLRAENNDVDSGGLKDLNHFFTAGFGEVIGEEAAVPYDQTHCHFGSCHGVRTLRIAYRTDE
jgi:hypothetical protein